MIKILAVTENPIQWIGRISAIAYGSDTTSATKNYDRGKRIIATNHSRMEEFPDVTVEISGYSNRCIRELYTHIIGVTRVQESTRYVDMSRRLTEFYTPPAVYTDTRARERYFVHMISTAEVYKDLVEWNIPREDAGNVITLGHDTRMILKINLRALIHLFELRTCSRAYREFRLLAFELRDTLATLGDREWQEIATMNFKTVCETVGYCTEETSCGKRPHKSEIEIIRRVVEDGV